MNPGSNYAGTADDWNQAIGQDEAEWVPCKRCYETGEDDDGADCIFCGGIGAVPLR